ncbi:malonate decarboxylase acyl carrier protein [Rhizobium sp. Root1220]|uniref:malonate decarboxylase acyl carrier protein n=1 Tax=Rhizobium sp. Root1220 TaxID=1736432 RepID=UPI0006F696FD|nr:malonate decarboxylase acyl carrier protein [Rhizobium sp. Root1220]KQV83849.1 malonate decarboxylase acyl carrier protein [Rhizobium sp. Root1220]
MEDLTFHHKTRKQASGDRKLAIVGVVASGNLEVLAERILPDNQCQIDIKTAAEGFKEVWAAVVHDFVERYAPGGLKLSINDGGARPDTVMLRLAQAVRVMEEQQ